MPHQLVSELSRILTGSVTPAQGEQLSHLNPASVSSHPARGCSEQPVLLPKEIIQRWGYLSVPRGVCRSPCLMRAHDRWVRGIWDVEELWLSSPHLSRLR